MKLYAAFKTDNDEFICASESETTTRKKMEDYNFEYGEYYISEYIPSILQVKAK